MALDFFFNSLKQVAIKIISRVKGRKERRQSSAFLEELCRRYSLAELQSATNNFDDELKLGEGGSGDVYKGFLYHGTSTVAIKRFSRSKSSGVGDEFQTDSQLLCQLCHQNLVLLIGFCNEREERILVYEYMNGGTLANRLHPACADPLPWKQRLEICIGVANGLHYLHTGAKYAVFHRNVISANIILSKNRGVWLSDFGLSKIGAPSMSKPKTKTETRILGTVGYMAPEYMEKGELTEKVMCSPLVLSYLKYYAVNWLLSMSLQKKGVWFSGYVNALENAAFME